MALFLAIDFLHSVLYNTKNFKEENYAIPDHAFSYSPRVGQRR